MRTYADYFNAQYAGPSASGPVRLTVVRGDIYSDAELMAEAEELMEQDEGPRELVPNPVPTPDLLPFGTNESMVWVLDTYVAV